MKTAKILKHGNSQAVRLPKEFHFAGTEVQIKHSGGDVLLLPGKLTYEQIMTAVGGFKGTIERRQPVRQKGKQLLTCQPMIHHPIGPPHHRN